MAGFATEVRRKIDSIFLTGPTLGERVEKTAAYNPAGTSVNLFTVAGGRVMLRALVGQVTVIVAKNAAANANTRLRHTPSTGAAAATNMCADLDCDTDNVDTVYSITGAAGVPMVDDARAGVIVPSFVTNQQILQPGIISKFYTTLTTGTIRWTLHYIPIDAGATVVAA